MTRGDIVKEYETWGSNNDRTFGYDSKTTTSYPKLTIGRQNQRVSYHHNAAVEKHHFGPSHPMKPFRLTLTNQLVYKYGMHDFLDVYKTRAATEEEVLDFHTSDYINFLKTVVPGEPIMRDNETLFNFGDDCPVFDGMWDYSCYYAGASLDAARKLINGQTDIAINWSGGLHHAKRSEASGFCYLNDIVMAILQLLRYHPRILYIDIDVHHGDGVEQAFYSTNRVMTLSFHKYDGQFFPATGNHDDIGGGLGKRYSLNVPLKDGIDDVSYTNLFKEVVNATIERYQPTAIVLQCGADSLAGDRLGCFSLNISAHGRCVELVKQFNLPLLVLGGGGYTPRNVSRLWTYETSVCLGAELEDDLPMNPYFEFFEPDYKLHPPLSSLSKFENKNTPKSLQTTVSRVHHQLKYLIGAPSVEMQEIPPDLAGLTDDVEAALADEAEDNDKGRRQKERNAGDILEHY